MWYFSWMKGAVCHKDIQLSLYSGLFQYVMSFTTLEFLGLQEDLSKHVPLQ